MTHPRALSKAFFPILFAAVAILTLWAARGASATTGVHWGGDPGATEPTAGHTTNPGHVWVAVGSTHDAGHVSSGGFFHDSCSGSYCYPADGGDWAVDLVDQTSGQFGGGGGVYLYLDWAGYAPGGVTPNLAHPASLYVLPNSIAGSGDCQYQRFEVYVEYTDTSNVYNFDNVGRLTFYHLTSPQYSSSSGYISSPVTRSSGSGSTIGYFNGLLIGEMWPLVTTSSCNGGTHAHIEGKTYHGRGAAYEWWGEGPENYLYQDDGSANAHIHWTRSTWDDTSWGTTVGFIGGRDTLYNMWDNPGYSTH
jgi:hypothetical protein